MSMVEYNKIETVYRRDEKTKKLVIGEFTNPTIEFCKDLPWTFTEKCDGISMRAYWDGHTVTFGGRTDRAQIPAPLLDRMNELFGGEANAQLFEQKFGETEVILFGEGYGPKIQNGGGYRNDVDFIIFDAMIAGNYQPRSSVEDIAQYFGIDVVPIVLEGTIAEGVDYVLHNRKSLIARNGALIEGLVGRPKIELRDRVGKRLICKIKFKDFE